MSRICRNMGDSAKLRFYELDHESKMRLHKTHSHTSTRLATEPRTREEKQSKETQTLEVWEWVLRSRIFDSWSSLQNRSFPESPMFLHIVRVLGGHQGGLVLRYGLERPAII